MISFVDKESDGGGNAEYIGVVEELERQNRRIVELMEEVQTVDTNIRQSKQYIKRELQINNANNLAASGSGQSSGQNMMMH